MDNIVSEIGKRLERVEKVLYRELRLKNY